MKKSPTNFLTICTKSNLLDYPELEVFYSEVIKELEGSDFAPRWNLDLYPARSFLKEAAQNEEFWLIKDKKSEEILAAMVLNQQGEPGYENARWQKELAENEIGYIHLLAVKDKAKGMGLARELMERAATAAKEQGIKAIRLDVIKGNTPALSVYPKLGFVQIGQVPLYYEDTGLMEFTLFERLL